MDVVEKKRLRNIISANKNRILRKKEPIFLYNSIDEKDWAFKDVSTFLQENIGAERMQQLSSSFLSSIGETANSLEEWYCDQ
jgi:hypothetical protein